MSYYRSLGKLLLTVEAASLVSETGRNHAFSYSAAIPGSGREVDCEISPPTINRLCVRFGVKGKRVSLEDLDSQNGFFVNNRWSPLRLLFPCIKVLQCRAEAFGSHDFKTKRIKEDKNEIDWVPLSQESD